MRDENLNHIARVSRRARASAYRVDARYLLDGGQTCISPIRVDARLVHSSANSFGAIKHTCFSNFEFVWLGEITFSDPA